MTENRGKLTKEFSEDVRKKCLLWCARHCCLCGKQCSLDIELHHIEDNLPQDRINLLDNALPVCYQCHAELERSKKRSPRGSSYYFQELRDRRDQLYETHTSHLVPVLVYEPFRAEQDPDTLVRFQITNTNGRLPVYAKCVIDIWIGRKFFGRPIRHYSGEELWACNPGITVCGWFDLVRTEQIKRNPTYNGTEPGKVRTRRVSLHVEMSIIDAYDREHRLLPLDWYFAKDRHIWVLDP